jgi:hypothetical protein
LSEKAYLGGLSMIVSFDMTVTKRIYVSHAKTQKEAVSFADDVSINVSGISEKSVLIWITPHMFVTDAKRNKNVHSKKGYTEE